MWPVAAVEGPAGHRTSVPGLSSERCLLPALVPREFAQKQLFLLREIAIDFADFPALVKDVRALIKANKMENGEGYMPSGVGCVVVSGGILWKTRVLHTCACAPMCSRVWKQAS